MMNYLKGKMIELKTLRCPVSLRTTQRKLDFWYQKAADTRTAAVLLQAIPDREQPTAAMNLATG